MDFDENENDARMLREQINHTRDAVGLARLVLTGQEQAAAAMMVNLLKDPLSIPWVMRALCGLIADALPRSIDPEAYFQSAYAMLDRVEGDC